MIHLFEIRLALAFRFRNSILKLMRGPPNQFFQCQDLKQVKLATPSRFDLSHLHKHKFKHASKKLLSLILWLYGYIVYRYTWLGNQKILIIDVSRDYLKKTMHNLFTFRRCSVK